MHIRRQSNSTRGQIRAMAEDSGLSVEFSPFESTMVTLDERLIVSAPYYPFMGQRALNETIEVLKTDLPTVDELKRRINGEDI